MSKSIQDQILRELHAAKHKFPAWPTDPLHALAILGEEFGELNKAVLQMTYEPHKTSLVEVKNEAIQTAAMAIRFLESLDRYDYRMSKQHEQSIGPLTSSPNLEDPIFLDSEEGEKGETLYRFFSGGKVYIIAAHEGFSILLTEGKLQITDNPELHEKLNDEVRLMGCYVFSV